MGQHHAAAFPLATPAAKATSDLTFETLVLGCALRHAYLRWVLAREPSGRRAVVGHPLAPSARRRLRAVGAAADGASHALKASPSVFFCPSLAPPHTPAAASLHGHACRDALLTRLDIARPQQEQRRRPWQATLVCLREGGQLSNTHQSPDRSQTPRNVLRCPWPMSRPGHDPGCYPTKSSPEASRASFGSMDPAGSRTDVLPCNVCSFFVRYRGCPPAHRPPTARPNRSRLASTA